MLIPRFVVGIFPIVAMLLGPATVCGQDFPTKTIRVVTSGVGGDSDIILRIIMPEISNRLGQPVVLENRPSGVIPAEIVARATPDGHTLLTMAAPFWSGSVLQKPPDDVMGVFSPIPSLTTSPAVLVAHPSLAANSVAELIALAKAKPGALNYGSGGTGGTSHLAAELLKSMAGINIVRVNYASGSARMAASLNGEVHVQFPSPGLAAPHVKSGKLKALAVTSAQPSALAPGVPTVAASGLPGYEVGGLIGMFAPARTPAAIINRLNQEVVRHLNQPDMKQRILDAGEEVATPTPDAFRSRLKTDMTRMGKLIKELGIAAK